MSDAAAVQAHPRTQNRLAGEASPYLRQHAYNPVDWYPWGEEALARARTEDKPIFLSIGYASCHWCHVMAHESFEDETVAALMNDAFVNIKVDREERPDIDAVYITAAQLMTGRAGWPLTIIMTPELVPFFAATYIPRSDRLGQVGMLTLVPIIKQRWLAQRDDLLGIAGQVVAALREAGEGESGAQLGLETLRQGYEELAARWDERYGGFGRAPKFPTPHNLTFLLRYWKRTGEPKALHMAERTLEAMSLGGMFDHIGYGFHRYSTDEQWKLPHFEKMLYDQALLTMAYTEAYQATGKAAYRTTAERVIAYVLRELAAPEGAFYSAEDADVAGEEGALYLWTDEQIRGVLGDEEAFWFGELFNVAPEGNYREEATGQQVGRNVLYLSKPVAELAEDMALPEAVLRERLERGRAALFRHRELRPHPTKDDKILTDWNGLMIAALAKAARAFGVAEHAQVAMRAADWVLATMGRGEAHLWHRYGRGQLAVPGLADDYAFLAWGLIELYEATFVVRYLQAALDLTATLLVHFWDADGGGLFLTADDAEPLPVRPREVYDGALPSANAVALNNLVRLAEMTGNVEYRDKAEQLVRAFAGQVQAAPSAHTQFLSGLDFLLGPRREVVVAGVRGAPDTEAMLQALWQRFLPRQVLLFHPADEEPPEIVRLAEFVAHQAAIGGRATAYVCQDYRCQLPATDVPALLERLDARPL